MDNKKNDPKRLSILLLEDSTKDAKLIKEYLSEYFKHEIQMDTVAIKSAFLSAISSKQYDLILADFTLPDMNGFLALELAKSNCPLTPFIIVSGTIGEETAVDLLKQGATDYVLKDNLGRLNNSIERAIKEAKELEELKQSDDDLHHMHMLLKSSLESPKDMIILAIDYNYNYLYFNNTHKKVMKYIYGQDVTYGMNIIECITSEIDKISAKKNYDLALTGVSHSTIQKYGDKESYYESFYNPIYNDKHEIIGTTVFARDISGRMNAEKQLKHERNIAQMYLDVAGVMLLVLDINGDITHINRKGCEILEYEEKDIIGKNWFENFLPKNIADTVRGYFKNIIENKIERGTHRENAVITACGKEKVIDWDHTIICDNRNNVIGVLSSGEDITEIRKTESALSESNEKYIAIFEKSPIAIEFYDANGVLLHANEACIELFGVLNRNELLGFKLFDNPNLSSEIKNRIANREHVKVELEFSFEEVKRLHLYQTHYSGIKILSLLITPMMSSNTFTGYVIQTEDVTEKKQKQKEIEYLVSHDYLTDLYNRHYYFEQFNVLNKPTYYPLGIMMLDVNGLKIINDAFGHTVGNIALKMLGDVLKTVFEKKDTVSRIGGDEYAVLLPNTSLEKLQKYKDRITAIVNTLRIENIELSLAIGYELKKSITEDIDDVQKLAENHMYRHKTTEGSSVRNRAITAILETLTDKYETERVHSKRVSRMCKQIGIELKLRADDIKELEQAGLFHDIGKISIPDGILNKPGKLTLEEYKIIKTHTEIGYQILRAADEYSDLAIHALHHHERWDGNGYPSGLKGKDIPLFSRIICVVDAYEAMTADRPYRNKMSEEYAILEITRCSETQFDPKIAKLFVEKVLKANWKLPM
ncbi:MAG: HD domain-containing phosphohydrolase [Bacillota bacterium]